MPASRRRLSANGPELRHDFSTRIRHRAVINRSAAGATTFERMNDQAVARPNGPHESDAALLGHRLPTMAVAGDRKSCFGQREKHAAMASPEDIQAILRPAIKGTSKKAEV